MAMVVVTLPIKRIEFDEELVGQVALITRVVPASELDDEAQAQLKEMKASLTKSGHPGAEAFGKLIAARARPVDPTLL